MFHVPNKKRIRTGPRATDDNIGNNGIFHGRFGVREVFMVASDGGGWEHVSVSIGGRQATRCPTWEEMCIIKSWFWDEEDCVVQFHPPASEYVNFHPYVLHLWRPTDTNIATPPKEFV